MQVQSDVLPALQAAVERAARTPGGRDRLNAAGLEGSSVHSLDEFRQIPIMPREELSEVQKRYLAVAGFSSIPLNQLPWLGLHSGGELDISYAGKDGAGIMAEVFSDLGIRAGDVVVSTFGYHMATAAHVFDDALHKLGATVVPAGPGSTELQQQLLLRTGATVFMGFPSFLHKIIRTLDASLRDGLRVRLAICGGEYAPTLRAELREGFGIDSREFYGLSIVGPIAFECSHRVGLHVRPEVFVEITDPITGKPTSPGSPGQIVVTPLQNEYALLRLGTGDVSAWVEGSCACGLRSPRLIGILGRVGESVKVRGVFIHPQDVRALPDREADVAVAQVVVRRATNGADVIALLIAPTPTCSDVPALFERAKAVFEERCRLRVDEVGLLSGEMSSRLIVDERSWEVGTAPQ
jgi:phenylacetate-CoA ligase